jgi:UDP-N-acetylglucosamine 2-epimerase
MQGRTIKIITVVGARPQFVKAAAVSRAIAAFNQQNHTHLEEQIVHTGQHYDDNMSRVFFEELRIQAPSVNLEVGSGAHGYQTGVMLERLEKILIECNPDVVLVYGDTNSTLAASLAASKLHVPVAHIEAGLRSFNRRMPEEINRVVTDHLSTILFCPTDTAVLNLAKEGITKEVYQVGDVMYDSVRFNSDLSDEVSDILRRLSLKSKSFYLATIHRAENTDEPERLQSILKAFNDIEVPILLPLHPRTKKTLGTLAHVSQNVRIIDPVSYFDMLALEKHSRIIFTDSGGVQKEAFWLGVPCITLRDETEWVELVQAGCNQVVGADTSAILEARRKAEETLARGVSMQTPDLYGDGRSSEKIAAILANMTNTNFS